MIVAPKGSIVLPLLFAALMVVGVAKRAPAQKVDCAKCQAECRHFSSYPDGAEADGHQRSTSQLPPTSANAHFQKAKKADPSFGGENVELAIHHYGLALKTAPQALNIRNHLAGALLHKGKNAQAVKHLEHLARQAPRNDKFITNLGYAYHRRGQETRALITYVKALTINPRNVRAQLFAGLSMESLGLRAEAIEAYQKVMELKPRNQRARAGLRRLGEVP